MASIATIRKAVTEAVQRAEQLGAPYSEVIQDPDDIQDGVVVIITRTRETIDGEPKTRVHYTELYASRVQF